MTVLAPREAYQRLAEDYDASPNALVALEQRVMPALLPARMNEITMIDVAAGTGRWARLGRARGAHAVAIDFCHAMRPQVQADARSLPLRDGSADLVICAFALGYAPRCFPELARITRPGGMLLVSDVHPQALKRGWTRTFRSRGEKIQVSSEPYEIRDLRAPGLEPSRLLEPRLGAPEREIFEQAGRLDLFEAACREPAIFIGCWLRAA